MMTDSYNYDNILLATWESGISMGKTGHLIIVLFIGFPIVTGQLKNLELLRAIGAFFIAYQPFYYVYLMAKVERELRSEAQKVGKPAPSKEEIGDATDPHVWGIYFGLMIIFGIAFMVLGWLGIADTRRDGASDAYRTYGIEPR